MVGNAYFQLAGWRKGLVLFLVRQLMGRQLTKGFGTHVYVADWQKCFTT